MANYANRTALQSEDGGDVFAPPADLDALVIAEEDRSHPNHYEHVTRVSDADPENVALLASFREHGWPRSQTISVWKDGKRFVVSNGRRRLTFVRIENARRKRERDPRGPIRPRVVLDDNPLLTETLANSMHKSDPPLVRARRFLELKQSGSMSANAAAAALGLTLAEANALATVLGAPNAELHEAVNAKVIPADVAARAVKAGSETTKRALEAAKTKSGRGRAKAAKDEVPKRARAVNAKTIAAVADVLTEGDGNVRVVAALCWAAGSTSEDPPAWLQKAIDAAKEA